MDLVIRSFARAPNPHLNFSPTDGARRDAEADRRFAIPGGFSSPLIPT
jgi:hypothetical protein